VIGPGGPDDFGRVDAAYTALLGAQVADPWLVLQTVATAAQRRLLLKGLQLAPGARVLDGGCGYGPVTMELAAMGPSHITGVDRSSEKIEIARTVAGELQAAGAFDPGAEVELRVGDLCALEEPDATFDAAVVRFVLEYLPEPGRALAELHRVIRPGGLCCVVDVEDGLSISHPAPLPAMAVLMDAFATMSAAQGVDRHIGRKLAGLLDDAGFDVVGLLVISQAEYGVSAPGELPRQFLVQRFANLRADLLRDGGISAADFDTALAALGTDTTPKTCSIEGHIAAVGARRG